MNVEQWHELNETVANEYASYREAHRQGSKIENLKRICKLAVDALKLSGMLSSVENRKIYPKVYEYRSETNQEILELGPAISIISNLPEPTDMSIVDCAMFYRELLQGALDSGAPAELFLATINYTNRLQSKFTSRIVFHDAESYEVLEARFRKRLINPECVGLVNHKGEGEHPLVASYRKSLRNVADTYLRNRNYAGSVRSLIRELDARYPEIDVISKHLRYEILFWTHYYNNLLEVLPVDELPSDFKNIKVDLTDSQAQRITELEDPRVENLLMRDMNISQVGGYIPRDANTSIVLSIPAILPEGVFYVDGSKIELFTVVDPFSDPIFQFLHEKSILIGGMPLAILSPSVANSGRTTLVEITIPQPYCPTIDLDESRQVKAIRNEDCRDLHGADFDPFLAKFAEILLAVKQDGWPSREKIISSLKATDGYAVDYWTADRKQTYHFFQPLVKLSVFMALRDRFLNRFNSAKASGHRGRDLKKILFEEIDLDAAGLQKYAKTIIREFIASKSDRGEWWKTVWAERTDFTKVRKEPDVARDIYNIIAPWFEIRGMVLDREVSAAGGDIDMLATSVSGGRLHRCGIEIKFAHHAKIEHGVSDQLPRYMDALMAEVGLLVAVWCKGSTFSEPRKYASISALEGELFKCIPRGKSIDIITVNASFRPPPSKSH